MMISTNNSSHDDVLNHGSTSTCLNHLLTFNNSSFLSSCGQETMMITISREIQETSSSSSSSSPSSSSSSASFDSFDWSDWMVLTESDHRLDGGMMSVDSCSDESIKALHTQPLLQQHHQLKRIHHLASESDGTISSQRKVVGDGVDVMHGRSKRPSSIMASGRASRRKNVKPSSSSSSLSVRFSDIVEIRHYDMVIGDHPLAHGGMAISCGWSYDCEESCSIDLDAMEEYGPQALSYMIMFGAKSLIHYSICRRVKRRGNALRMSYAQRCERLCHGTGLSIQSLQRMEDEQMMMTNNYIVPTRYCGTRIAQQRGSDNYDNNMMMWSKSSLLPLTRHQSSCCDFQTVAGTGAAIAEPIAAA
jgi:hypothetical protein